MTSRVPLLAASLLLALPLAACGGSDSGGGESEQVAPTPSPSEFPQPKGRTMMQMYNELGSGGPVLAPTGRQLVPGKQRYGFALFTTEREQISGVPVAVYVQRSGSTKVLGPFVARDLKLDVAPPYQSETVARDDDAAKTLYVSDIEFPKPGGWAVMAVAEIDGELVATSPSPAQVLPPAKDPVPDVGDKAPVIETPTEADVGNDLASIDTREPPSSMHEVNYAEVIGKKPIMLLFVTPALCQSRVCGPVLDIAEEVKAESGDEAAWIHMEVYQDNEIKPGCLEGTRPAAECLRPQFRAFNLSTEPWVFAINRDGKVAARLEGAYSKAELEDALEAATKG